MGDADDDDGTRLDVAKEMVMELVLDKTFEVRRAEPSGRALAVAAMFGLGIEARERVEVLHDARVPVEAGKIVLITGDSGSGKSTMLREIMAGLRGRGVGVFGLQVGASDMELQRGLTAGRTLVDALGDLPLALALEHLARAGLADARLMLRRPEELSDGQRYRFELARFFAGEKRVLVADEFCATLDRVTAKVVAHQLRKFISRSAGAGAARTAIVATTHEDLRDDLRPDVVITRRLGATV